jgi:hypothetical protein
MSHRPRLFRGALGFTAALLSLLLVQNAFGIPFRQANSNLSPRTLYHNLDSLAGAVFTGTSHIVGNLQTLYELRQLALTNSQPQRSGAVFSVSPSSSVVCLFRAVPAPSGTNYRCPLSRRTSTSPSSVGRC